MAAAGPARYKYVKIDGAIQNDTTRAKTTANPYNINATQFCTLEQLYKDIPEEKWVNNYAKIVVSSRFYVQRVQNPDRIKFNQIFSIPLSHQEALRAAASGPAGAAFSGRDRRPDQYYESPKGGKNRRTKRRHNKKRQTKRRR